MKNASLLYVKLFLFASLLTFQAIAGDHPLNTNWKYLPKAPTGRGVGMGNPLPYPDAIHPNSLVVGVGFGVVRLDGQGKELFCFTTPEGAMSPAIGDVNHDGKAEIVLPTDNGTIYCLDAQGKQLWKTALNDYLYDFGSAVVADLDGDGTLETLINARAGTLYCLGSDGSLRWKVYAEPRACSPAVGDIDGDGKAEIFYGTDVSKIYCLNYQGKYLWHTEVADRVFGRSGPHLADLNGDGRYELLMPHSNTTPYPAIVALDAHSGKLLWTGHTLMQNYAGTTLVDIDHDGQLETLVVDKGNTVTAFGADGTIKWQTSLVGHGIFFAAGVADFFNDGHYEIICGCRQTGTKGETMFLLDEKGKLLETYCDGTDRESSPVIADLNGDQKPEIYFTDGGSGYVVSYSLEGTKAGGKVPWSYWKRTPDNRDFTPSSSTKHYAVETKIPSPKEQSQTLSVFIGQNTLPLTLPQNAKGKDLILETRVTDSHNATTANFHWIANPNNTIDIPFRLENTERTVLEYSVRDRSSRILIAHDILQLSAAGYAKDKQLVEKASAEMKSILNNLPISDAPRTGELQARIGQMKNTLADVSAKTTTAANKATNLWIESNRQKLLTTMDYLRFLGRIRAAGNQNTFYVWQDPNPWDEVKPEAIYPQGVKRDTTRLEMLAMGNETEAFACFITNLSEGSQQVKIYPYAITNGTGQKIAIDGIIELREAIITPDPRGSVDEALPRLNEGNTLYLAPGDSRKLWININTKNLAPGSYRFCLGFESVSMTEAVQTLQVDLRVSKVKVPEKSEFAFCTWSGLPDSEPMRSNVLKDLIDHKITVLPQIATPSLSIDDHLQVKAEWRDWDKQYLPLKDKMICMLFNPIQPTVAGRVLTSVERAKLLREMYTLLVRGMNERGFDSSQWGVYVKDEPGLTGYASIAEGVQIAREIKEANPAVHLYIDPAGMVSPTSMKPFEGLIDTYCPQVDLLKDPEGKLLNYFHQLGKRIWFYEAPSPARTFHPLGHYRIQAWLAFDYGLTGSGFYCYHYNGTDNLWRIKSTYPGSIDNYSVVYNDGLNIVPSRRWEGSRDGIEDYHLLMMLKRKIAAFKKGNADQKALALEAESAMNRIVHQITANVKKIKEINRSFVPYDVDYALFTKGRAELIGYLERME